MNDFLNVDIRTIIAVPNRRKPVMIECPWHDDPLGSLAVYADHGYCYGCWKYLRRYEMAAYLLGVWDGKPETVDAAIQKARKKIKHVKPYVQPTATQRPPQELDPAIPGTFHRYLLSKPDDLAFFQEWRGYSIDSIRKFQLGYTGTHFTIPVYSLSGDVRSIRYRIDPRIPAASDGSKYEGLNGRNEAQLFSLPSFAGLTEVSSLYVVEGEYDDIAGDQLGLCVATITNGAGRIADTFLDSWRRLNISVRQWVIATDQDEAGERAAWELAKSLPSPVRARWSGKDMNEYMHAGGDASSIRLEPVRH